MSEEKTEYYLHPNCWVIQAPVNALTASLPPEVWTEIVFTHQMQCGIQTQVSREGVFEFDLSSGPDFYKPLTKKDASHDDKSQLTRRRLRLLHAHIACLHSALTELHGGTMFKMLIDPNYSWLLNIFSYREPAYREATVTIPENVLKRSFELLDSMVTHQEEDTLLLAELILHACKYLEEVKFELSLISAWAALERLITDFWRNYIDNCGVGLPPQQAPKINKDRRKKLVEGRDFTISVITEILSLRGLIPHDTYEAIDRVRKSRNDWIHDLKPVSEENAYDAIKLARSLFQHMRNIPLKLEPLRAMRYI